MFKQHSFILSLVLFFSMISFAYGFNSNVKPEDLAKMSRAGISQQVIQFLVENQTCSIGPDDLIQMHSIGFKGDAMIEVIKADLYNNKKQSTAEKEAIIMERLKKAGMSDEAILQYIETTRSNEIVDQNGKSVIRYGSPREQHPLDGAVFPKHDSSQMPSMPVIINKDESGQSTTTIQ